MLAGSLILLNTYVFTLPGAKVTVRGSKHGAIAGLDGHYTFNIPAQEGLILTYSFIGMEKKTVRYTGKKTINVTLNSSSTEIDEVVVTLSLIHI